MNQTPRLPMLDQLRGFAFVLMAIFHFFFDMVFLLRIPIPMFSHPAWIGFRIVIVLLFLGLVGICLSLNFQRGLNIKKFEIRLLKLFLVAGLITVSTWLLMPELVIFFGIIHLIAVSTLLALPFLYIAGKKYRYYYGALGVVLLIIGHMFQPIATQSALSFLWLTSPIPQTADYAPIIPWFGFVLLGLMLGWEAEKWAHRQYLPTYLDRSLRWCGRHALILYVVHQPILWAGFFIYIYIVRTLG